MQNVNLINNGEAEKNKTEDYVTYFGCFVPVFGQKKMFITYCKYSRKIEVQIPCLHKQQTNIEMFSVMRVIVNTSASKDFQSLIAVVWKNTACTRTSVK